MHKYFNITLKTGEIEAIKTDEVRKSALDSPAPHTTTMSLNIGLFSA